MKTAILLSLVAALLAGPAVSAAPTSAASARAVIDDDHSTRTLVIAHRACWHEGPENSLTAVRACEHMGADGVELDVHHTKDGVAVVIHDDTVDRMTNGTGKVADLAWAQLSRLRLRQGRGGPDAALTAEHVPTLDAYLRAAKDRLLIVFDVKDWSQQSTFAAIERHGMARQAIFFYECGNDRLLNNVRSFFGRVAMFPIMFEKDGPLAPALGRCPSHPLGRAHVKYQHTAWIDTAVPSLRAANQRTWIATMFPADNAGFDDKRALTDPAAVWGSQIDAGAQMIMTNEPRALITYLAHR